MEEEERKRERGVERDFTHYYYYYIIILFNIISLKGRDF